MHAVCNVLQGHYILYSNNLPHASLLTRFHNRMHQEIMRDDYFKQITDPFLLQISFLPDQKENGVPLVPGKPAVLRFSYPVWARITRMVVFGGECEGIPGILTDISNVPSEWYNPADSTGLVDRAMINFYQVPAFNLVVPPAGIPRVNTANAPISFIIPGNPYFLSFQSDDMRDNFLTFARADLQLRFARDAGAAAFAYTKINNVGAAFNLLAYF